MYDSAVLRFALISGLIGFSSFCVSYAFLVWRRRNVASTGQQSTPADTLRRWSACLALSGVLAVGIALAVRELDRAEGVLSSDGLYAIRVPDDEYRVTYLAEGSSLKEGDLVARLESPEAEAKVQELELQCRRLEKQRDALRLESLELDHELVRHQQNAITAANQLRTSIGQLLPEHESVARQAMMERLTRLEKIAKLDVDIGWCEGELTRACQHQTYASRELERVTKLIDRDAVSESDVDSTREQVYDAHAEIANLKQRIEGMRNEKTQIEQSLEEIAILTSGQQDVLVSELNRARADYAVVESENTELAAKLVADLERARSLRQRELEQLDLKIEECRVQLAGVEKTLIVRAPYDGTVVYRDPSPRSADQQQPLFVLARQPGFRLQARLPRIQVAALKNAGEVTMELVDPAVKPYFGGTFLNARPMPHKPGYVVAELACQPPEETIRELMEGEKIMATLRWRPPLTTLLPFRVGAVLALTGVAGWAVSFIGLARRRPTQHPRGRNGHGPVPHVLLSGTSNAATERKRSVETPIPRAADLESGSVSALHELLGERLREVVLRDEIDSDLLSAVEWALDRHHVRAVRQIRVGLGCDVALEERVSQLHQEAEAASKVHGNGSHRDNDRERALRVLRTIDSHLADSYANPC